jgi:2,3-bisphosphoglycerate-independent phosphoglycerate mutase
VLAAHKRRTCACRTECAHVAYFFNGGREECFPGEDRAGARRRRCRPDLQPEMSAAGVADALIANVS